MKFNLDTNNYENIQLTFTENDCEQDLSILIQEFCYAISSFFVDFAMKLDCNTEKAKGLSEVFLDCTKRNINLMLDQGVLERQWAEISEEELKELEDKLKNSGFADDEITNIIHLVNDLGSVEAANEYLMKIADEAGIDIDVNIDEEQ